MDSQIFEDNGYKFILNYQDCYSKFNILRPLKIKTVAEVADCLMGIFFKHGPPSILQTDNRAEFSNKKLRVRIKELWTGTHIVHCRSSGAPGQCGVARQFRGCEKQILVGTVVATNVKRLNGGCGACGNAATVTRN